MSVTLAFDVYGTLVDPLGISKDVEDLIGARAAQFARAWREKQLEYLFRRGLGRDYRPFSVCTAQALDHTCDMLEVDVLADTRAALLARYRKLPAYPDASPALRSLSDRGFRCFAFSNGEPADLAVLLKNAMLDRHLEGIVSVDAVLSFKPDPAVYRHFLDATGSNAGDTWLVSGNPFDVIGAATSGWNTAWLRRDPKALFDPWGVEPTLVIESLQELAMVLGERARSRY